MWYGKCFDPETKSLIIGFRSLLCKEAESHYEQWKNTEVIDMPSPGEVQTETYGQKLPNNFAILAIHQMTAFCTRA